MTALKFNPNVAAAPIYVGGASTDQIKKEYGLEDVIKIASNESPLGPSPAAVAAMQDAAAGLNRYPPMGDEALRTALAEAIGQGLSPDNFITGNGGCDVLSMVATSFLAAGDGCVICRPTFPVYDITARRIGAQITYVDLEPDQFSYDIEAILAAVTDQTRLVYVCSPNNPTGACLTAGQMETLVNNLPPHVLLVADEVYHHFAIDQTYPDTLEYVRQSKNVLVLHSFSKAYGLAGLRLGYGIAPAEVADYLARARLPFHLDTMTMAGGIAALRDADHVTKTVALVTAQRDWLHQHLAGLGLTTWPSQANFILFQPPFAAADVSERLLQRGVIVRPMGQFYLPTHLRVTVGLPEENRRFVKTLQTVLHQLEQEGAPKAADTAANSRQFKF